MKSLLVITNVLYLYIWRNGLPEFLSAALLSIDDVIAWSHSSVVQTENLFCAIMLKVNEKVHEIIYEKIH